MSPTPDIPEKDIRERCTSLLSSAAEEAQRLQHNYIGVEHLFIATTYDHNGEVCQLLKRAGLNPQKVRNEIRREIGKGDDELEEVLPLTPRAVMVLSLAIFFANQQPGSQITERHFLLSILQEGESVPIRKLIEMNFDINFWLQELLEDMKNLPPVSSDFSDRLDGDYNWEDDEDSNDFFNDQHPPVIFDPPSARSLFEKKSGSMNTPLLDRYGRDLTAQASAGKIHPAIARDKEIRSLARTLARSKKNNPLLLGDAGVGKTAIVEGLAYAIHHQSAAKSLLGKRIIQIEIGNLVAGTSLRGQFEERLIGIVEEVRRSSNIILFIDEIHTIVGAGDTIDSNLDAANILKPALARGEINCIGATTHEEYRKAIAKDPALERRFRVINVEEPDEQASIQILKEDRKRLELHHEVSISEDAITAAVRLSIRYLPDRRLPDKAIDLLDEACTRVTIQTISPDVELSDFMEVSSEDIHLVISEWTGIPIHELDSEEQKQLSNLGDQIREFVIGQDQAVDLVADTIKTARAGLNAPHKPVGVFLFLGPSGVGKTQLAETLAQLVFGSDHALLRLDMSEFHDAHTVARLIGSPPGYKESSQGGQLTDGLRRRPYCVVLLDEVEKAAPEVFDLFLQIFDEGRVSDAHGRPVDARHAIFIMTSNIGTDIAQKQFGFQKDGQIVTDQFKDALKAFFRPEFINRLDEIVVFNSLDNEVLEKILDLEMQALIERLKTQGISLQLSEASRQRILQEGYAPDKGARPLQRAIERLIARPLSHELVKGIYKAGDSIQAVCDEKGLIRFVDYDNAEQS
ncbi:ATP-dependent Clp protease ATP-binding subunit [Anaerolineales bacterium]